MSANLYDADTAEPIGPATTEQHEASDRSDEKGEHGVILIEAEGNVCPAGSWDAQQPGTRRVYTL